MGTDEQRNDSAEEDGAVSMSPSTSLLAQAIALLKVAKCPACDGSGVIPVQTCARQYVTREMAMDAGQPEMEGSMYCDDEWEPQECQWCDERDTLLRANNMLTVSGGATGSEFQHLRLHNPIVAQIMRAGGTAEDCAVALTVHNDRLVDRLMVMEGIAPRRIKLMDGRVMVWHCPDHLIPETDMSNVNGQLPNHCPASGKEATDMRCEGQRRHGGAFSLGPVQWVQCTSPATVMLKVKQDGETVELPGCNACWNECFENEGIKVLSVRPLTDMTIDVHKSNAGIETPQ